MPIEEFKKEIRAKEHALAIFEERNKAFRVLYDTVIEVEGALDSEIYPLLCKNLFRICEASFAAIASYDLETSTLTLEAVVGGRDDDSPLVAVRPGISCRFPKEAAVAMLKKPISECRDHEGCLVDVFNDYFKENFIHQCDLKCYRLAYVRENELLAVGMVQFKSLKKLKMKDMVETFMSMSSVIIQRMNSVRALRKSEENLRAVFDTAVDQVFIKDASLRYVRVNPAMEKALGREAKEILHKRDADIFGKEEAAKDIKSDRKALKGHVVEQEQVKFICNKKRTYHVVKAPLQVEGEIVGVCGIARDITYREEMEQELKRKNKELNDFTYTVSHDLKNPINLIKCLLNLAREKPEKNDDLLEKAFKQLDYLTSFIDNLLKLSRVGMVIDRKVDVVLEKAVNMAYHLAKPGNLNSRLAMDNNVQVVKGDPTRIEQLFLNLFQNSIKYRDPEKDELVLKVSSRDCGDYVVIRFADNGIGIERDDLDKIFNLGFTKHREKGQGFGLSIVDKIVKAHQGEITVCSDGKGKGTEFIIRLPAA